MCHIIFVVKFIYFNPVFALLLQTSKQTSKTDWLSKQTNASEMKFVAFVCKIHMCLILLVLVLHKAIDKMDFIWICQMVEPDSFISLLQTNFLALGNYENTMAFCLRKCASHIYYSNTMRNLVANIVVTYWGG